MTKMTAEEANAFLKGAFETQDNRSEVVRWKTVAL